MWRNLKYLRICHVEKTQISPYLSRGEIWNFSTSTMWRKFRFLHMTDGEIGNVMCVIFCTLYVAFSLFCCKICCLQFTLFFSAKSVLSRFTRFCVEKKWAKTCAHGEKWQISGVNYYPNINVDRCNFSQNTVHKFYPVQFWHPLPWNPICIKTKVGGGSVVKLSIEDTGWS